MTRISIETPPSFRFDATMMSHGWIMLEPFGYDDDLTTLERILQIPGGRAVQVFIRSTAGGALEVEAPAEVLTPKERAEVASAVRHIFNLDLDLSLFYELLRGHERYAWVERRGAGRLLRSATVWEDLAKTLLTTNTTWAMTKQMVSRLCRLGEQLDEEHFAFPTAERIAEMGLNAVSEKVRAGYRNAYLHELAVGIASGKTDAESWARERIPAGDLRKLLRSLKGFGPYAAGTMLKLLGSFDDLAIDSAARSMFAKEFREGTAPKDKEIAAHYEHYGEWRGLVIWMDLLRDWFAAHEVPALL